MGLFNRNISEKRSIDDILTPKEIDGESTEESKDISNNEESENITEENVIASEKVSKNDIQIETPEEVSFNALTCFGWSETKTPKWLIKCAHFWYGTMSFFWFVLGALTFAPIIFMQKKVNVIFKDRLKSFVVATVIYALFLALIIVLLATRNGDKAKEVVETVDEVVAK
jgi:hypothetical protein